MYSDGRRQTVANRPKAAVQLYLSSQGRFTFVSESPHRKVSKIQQTTDFGFIVLFFVFTERG